MDLFVWEPLGFFKKAHFKLLVSHAQHAQQAYHRGTFDSKTKFAALFQGDHAL